ncbi:hypothetical protein OQZ33_21575 [Pedobacter sp. MC2016-05]|uniref:type IV toxin-antitoxin system AbiEi family antitoxin domain-containing protein n=1 Tax=Pedobacter sp. MC2016-05 TaxID=2994474 RepID=UPI002247E51F|nr:hypothetical protein [Pedobacter sp. MC2016-05]MCX2476939.1 hypothetical protein [Pedobacter sp. MC2016-05]
MNFRNSVKAFTNAPLNRLVILDMLKDYKRPNDKISELIKHGDLIQLKKGLYVPGVSLDVAGPELFVIANHLWGPSYVSLESAMSYWGLIPERVYQVSSITLKLSKKYKTPKGTFSYRAMPFPYYSFGTLSIELSPGQVAVIATPEKALCDKIITTSGLILRSRAQTLSFLLDDLRMDRALLEKFDLKALSLWIKDAPKNESLRILVKTLEKI